jgi:flavin-binding protein dodecin
VSWAKVCNLGASRYSNLMIENGNITGYKVNVEITFQLEDPAKR